jgi:glycosyltransferase involved in cell wall biosynthesis
MLMEMSYSGKDDLAPFMLEKLKLIAQADFFTCAGEIQRKYFEPWLLLAGHDARDLPIQTVPLSLSPHLPAHHAPEEEPVFIYGGSPLPWQDPALGLHILVEELERAARGKLRLFGGAPGNEAPERFIKLWSEMDESTCVDRSGLLARSEVLEMLTHASIAWDVMARNPERELAFTTRTVEYLWCGLPVVYNDYAELASYIAEYEAGWTVDPGDTDAMRAIIRRILSDPDEVRRRGENARRLVRERLTWDRTIAPLDVFCRNPREARRGPNLLDYALSKTRIKRALRRTLKRMIMDIVKWFEQPQQTPRIRR